MPVCACISSCSVYCVVLCVTVFVCWSGSSPHTALQVSQWLASEVVRESDVKRRALRLEHVIRIGVALRELKCASQLCALGVWCACVYLCTCMLSVCLCACVCIHVHTSSRPIRNYNGAMMVFAALNCTPVDRLKRTYELVSPIGKRAVNVRRNRVKSRRIA